MWNLIVIEMQHYQMNKAKEQTTTAVLLLSWFTLDYVNLILSRTFHMRWVIYIPDTNDSSFILFQWLVAEMSQEI